MKNRLIMAVIVISIAFQGCAGRNDMALSQKDYDSLKKVKIVRYEFPGYKKDTMASTVTATAVLAPFLLLGALGGGIGGGLAYAIKEEMMISAGREIQTKYNLPDFSHLVHDSFSKEILENYIEGPQWEVDQVVLEGDLKQSSGCLLTIKTEVVITDEEGLQTYTCAQLIDSGLYVFWNKEVIYKTPVNRLYKLAELEANNGKLLREEISFAVEKTIDELLDHFDSEPSEDIK